MKKTNVIKQITATNVIIIAFLFINCKTPSDRILDAFNKVNESIIKSSSVEDSRIDSIYSAINLSKKNDHNLMLNADSVLHTMQAGIGFVDSIINMMELKDSIGERTDIAENMLINSNLGMSLINKIKAEKFYLDLYTNNTNIKMGDLVFSDFDKTIDNLT